LIIDSANAPNLSRSGDGETLMNLAAMSDIFATFANLPSNINLAFMPIKQFLLVVHPMLTVAFVFPLVGITVMMAWQTRQRRLQVADGGKSKIPAIAGPEHVKIGRFLAASVVGTALLALAYAISAKWLQPNYLADHNLTTFNVVFLVAVFIATIACLVFLYMAREKLWRGVFATLTGMGLVLIGCQEGVWRWSEKWYFSHYYYGLTVAMLMIVSVAVLPEIYQDRSNRWRIVHTVLNCMALLIFLVQAMTGARDLFDLGAVGLS
jgi:hypothetical protein